MLNAKLLDDLATKLADSVPPGLQALQADLEKNFRAVLQSNFSKLNLVTRDEFEAQKKVLEQTRLQLIALETRITELETARKSD